MLLYCDYEKNDRYVEVKKDTEIYNLLSGIYSGMNTKKLKLDDREFDLLLVKNYEKMYLCISYGNLPGPVVMYENQYDDYKKNKHKFSMLNDMEKFEYVSYEFYEVKEYELILQTIIVYNEDNDRDIYYGNYGIIELFKTIKSDVSDFDYNTDNRIKYVNDMSILLFFYNYNGYTNIECDSNGYCFQSYDEGVYNTILKYKYIQPNSSEEKLNEKEKQLNIREQNLNLQEEKLISLMKKLKNREEELFEKELNIMIKNSNSVLE